jgi:hypothetical protein
MGPKESRPATAPWSIANQAGIKDRPASTADDSENGDRSIAGMGSFPELVSFEWATGCEISDYFKAENSTLKTRWLPLPVESS